MLFIYIIILVLFIFPNYKNITIRTVKSQKLTKLLIETADSDSDSKIYFAGISVLYH